MTPIAHQWEPIPVHAGPDEWRCVRCGLETTFSSEARALLGVCGPVAESITPHVDPRAADTRTFNADILRSDFANKDPFHD